MKCGTLLTVIGTLGALGVSTDAATTLKRYYARGAVEDKHGVIAPWYRAQNGQCDFRARVAAETLKRYPWTDAKKAAAALPEFVFSGAWAITPEGAITVPPINDWANGDLGQRAAYLMSGLIDYYRYSGDPTAIALVSLQADALLDFCLTPADHPWPNFLISVPARGKPYGPADPRGFIQLDIVAEAGIPLLRAAQITGNRRWMDAVRHWGDLLAEKRNRTPGLPPWNRYANPQDVPWEDHQTGGVAYILEFLDALIRSGYRGNGGAIVEARDSGRVYMRDVLLPRWTVNDTWGRNYWDWNDPVQAENVTEFVARYMMDHQDVFPNWRADVRNILGLFLNHTSVAPASRGDVYSGAWAYPESSSCCGLSLWYAPMNVSPTFAQYGVLADSEWGRELARRQMILATYDCSETGVVEDNIDGGQIVAGAWFKIAHPMALKYTLAMIGWMPEVFGAARENHIVRSTSVVTSVQYGKGRVAYTTADAPAETTDVLRLAFRPTSIRFAPVARPAGALAVQMNPGTNRMQVKELGGGDFIVIVRHDGNESVVIEGEDPQEWVDDAALTFAGEWKQVDRGEAAGGGIRASSAAGATVTHTFTGNQVRVIGSVGPEGGLATVTLDGVQQLVGIDCWNPAARHQQVLYCRNGLADAQHTLTITAKGAHNSVSRGSGIEIDGVQVSAAKGGSGFGEGGGPKDSQRMIFGYAGREDYVDSQGNAWRPGTEFVVRAGDRADSVAASWWTSRTQLAIPNAKDPELYRYGIHGRDFWVDVTVGPGTYHARLKFCETRRIEPRLRAMNITINGGEVAKNFDIAATACGKPELLKPPGWHFALWGGMGQPVDLVFNNLQPRNGVISIRFSGAFGGEAILQALEVGPGDGGQGAAPVACTTAPATSAPE